MFLKFIPLARTLNRLAGALFGLVEGAIVLGVIFYVCLQYLPASFFVRSWIRDSAVAEYLIEFVERLKIFLPMIVS